MAVTIYDIAREAKVGIGTVSRVFNGNPNVNPKTKDRVLTISKQLNYHPHAFAQALARRRTNTIAAIIPFFTNYFFVEILQGIQDKITNLGYDLILYGVTHARDVEEYLKKSLQRGRVDGILFFSTEFPYHYIERYSGESKPFVLVDTYHDKFDSIFVENFQGAVTATKHLITLGHSHIGMIDANLNNAPARERLRGFTEAMHTSGLEIDQKNVLISKFQKYDGYSREAGYLAMKELIERSTNLPSALFIASDVQAIGVLSALQEHGIGVPDDIAIVSFDDIELAAHFELTTMRQPMYRMGELAVEKLFQRMENPDAPPSHIHFVPSLIIRGSCGMNKDYSHIHEFSKTAE